MKNNNLKRLEAIDAEGFRCDLINWFMEEKRDLPWRQDRDPYKIWVSEIMLQQTRVDTVIPYFTRFIEQFPTVKALSEAEEENILKAWEGLGYYSRARNLHSAVKEVQEKYGGKVPEDPKEISSLKGVGPYTAGAILSIAYGKAEPAVDGNVMRVLSRILSIWEDIAKPATRKIFEKAVRQLISHDNPSYFNQALMELGAIVCTPSSPSCLLCPVREHCSAFHEGVQDELPVKIKNKKQRAVHLAAVVLQDERGRTLIHKRPENGLLANLWEFPNVEIHLPYRSEGEQLQEYIRSEFGVEMQLGDMAGTIDHVFSHLTWNIHVYQGTLLTIPDERQDLKIVSTTEIDIYPFPVSHQKIIMQYYKK
nr:A/G-specific adenine glycosylase [uncultured Bacillus sp.]